MNTLVYEPNHNYLKDLHIQQKKRFYPTMADTSKEFSNLVFPSSSYTIKTRKRQLEALSYSKNLKKDHPGTTPFHGNWTIDRARPHELVPAGLRIPKGFKQRLGDKIPVLVDKLKREGAKHDEIKQIVGVSMTKSVEKYRNKPKIGLAIETRNWELLN